VDYPRRILVVGNGARENALANALLKSREVEKLWITPANWGVLDPYFADERRIDRLELAATDRAGVVAAATVLRVDLVVIGPEAPLVAGLADELRAAGIAAFGPGKYAAQLEGSKSFAKQFMQRHRIPTADFEVFDDLAELSEYIESHETGSLVLKADGLAAGKGVIVCDNKAEALAAAERMLGQREFGGDTVVAEERLSGPEISFTCLIAGGRAEVLPPSSDYKRLLDGDQGPNTGGMGNICPTPHATDEVVVDFTRNILAPFMRGLREEEIDYRGFLFVGTMVTAQGLKVIEFNVRLGDPEAAVVLPLCEADWPLLFAQVAAGELPVAPPSAAVTNSVIEVRDAACVAVAIASANYPYGKSDPERIEGLDRIEARGLLRSDGAHGDVQVLFAGVDRAENGTLLATGGRCLTISARAENLSLARRLVYEVVGNIRFAGMQFRSDIGKLG
jgi:phosphoribosylamine---glycine ligase